MKRTVHTFTGSCSRFVDEHPKCDPSHFRQISVIDLRGTFRMRDMVSDESLQSLYVGGNVIKR